MITRSFVSTLLAAAIATLLSPPPTVIADEASQASEPQNSCASAEPALFWRCAKEKVKTFDPPRTADGKPDLSGYWRQTTQGKEGLEEGAGPNSSTAAVPGKSLVVDPPDGKLPLQPWAAAQKKENAASGPARYLAIIRIAKESASICPRPRPPVGAGAGGGPNSAAMTRIRFVDLSSVSVFALA